MNAFLLYLLLLKATCTSFSGMASLPVLRNDLVGHYHVLTDEQLTRAIAAGRTGPGPIGLYIVCTGYIVDGIPGAIAGLAAMNTPAFLIIFLLKWLGARAERPAVQRTIRSTLLAAAGLLIATSVRLAESAITSPVEAGISAAAFALLAFTAVDSLWIMAAAAALGVAARLMGA